MRHQVGLICRTSATAGGLAWRAECHDCPWRGDEYPVAQQRALDEARADRRMHETAPAGARGFDHVPAEWIRGGR